MKEPSKLLFTSMPRDLEGKDKPRRPKERKFLLYLLLDWTLSVPKYLKEVKDL